MRRTSRPLTGILATTVLVCLTMMSTGCSGSSAAPIRPTPTTTAELCDALGPLAEVCTKTFTSVRIKGGEPEWASLPALRLTLSSTPKEQTPYTNIKTGVNITMTRVDVTPDQLKPLGKTVTSAAGPGNDAQATRERWVVDFTNSPMRWSLSPDRSRLTLAQGENGIVFPTG